MPIILEPNIEAGGGEYNYFHYPHPTKVLTGTVYGRANQFVGLLVPDNYVPDLERLRKLDDQQKNFRG